MAPRAAAALVVPGLLALLAVVKLRASSEAAAARRAAASTSPSAAPSSSSSSSSSSSPSAPSAAAGEGEAAGAARGKRGALPAATSVRNLPLGADGAGAAADGELDAKFASAAGPTRFLCVYCGSSSGGPDDRFLVAARALGRALVRRNIGLVYGGGGIGVMGAVAQAVDEAGGVVVSVIPTPLMRFCDPMIQPERLIEVADMHTRKKIMIDRSSAFMALPGGVGTMEELLETATWLQLGLHSKRLGVLNVDGYWNPLRAQFAEGVARGFIKQQDGYCIFDEDAERLLDVLFADSRLESDVKGLTSWVV